MSAAIRQIVTVRRGGVVEVRSDELREGDRAEVTVVVMPAAIVAPAVPDPSGWRRYAGAGNTGDTRAGDNERIDADLADEYSLDAETEP